HPHHVILRFAQVILDEFQNIRFVINDQNTRPCHSAPLCPPLRVPREPASHFAPLQATESLHVAQASRKESYYQHSAGGKMAVRPLTFLLSSRTPAPIQ